VESLLLWQFSCRREKEGGVCSAEGGKNVLVKCGGREFMGLGEAEVESMVGVSVGRPIIDEDEGSYP
jgi:hypothetical protein